MAKLQTSPHFVLLGLPGCLTSQTLLKHGEDYSSRKDDDIRPLSGGTEWHHAVLICFSGSWPGMLIAGRQRLPENPEIQSELDSPLPEAQGCSNTHVAFIHLGLGRGLKDKGLGHMLPWVWQFSF